MSLLAAIKRVASRQIVSYAALSFTTLCCLFGGKVQAQQHYGRLEFLGRLPAALNENSGIERLDAGAIWVIEDNGNKDHLYAINLNGQLIRELEVKGAANRDWEDLAQDEEGNLYIGDFGNNHNDRRDLVIYRIARPKYGGNREVHAQAIRFRYPGQKKFPPKKSKRHYDAEALYHWNSSLYIVTKNRAEPFDGVAYIYRVPDTPGDYTAQLIDSLIPCRNPKNCRITGADISSDGKMLALLGYGQLFLLRDFDPERPSKSNIQVVDLRYPSQTESICFENENSLLIGDEQSQTKGRNLYRLRLDGLPYK